MSAEERAARADAADRLCRDAYWASGGPDAGVALVAVGGYGRGELAPSSDLDVVLVSDAGVDVGEFATHLWYPLWDSGHKIDHSVRTLDEMIQAAHDDPRVALGLLDLRHLAGDTHLTLRLRTAVLGDWRRRARERLVEVGELTRKRHAVVGELAHASVPDLKEAAGGLRDATVLRALVATWLVDVPHSDLERCRRAILDVRDHVHTLAGRAVDRVQPEMWAPLAEALGMENAEAAQRHVRAHGRRLAHLTRLTWRRVDAVLAAGWRSEAIPVVTERLAPGVLREGHEVVLEPTDSPRRDPLLLLRAVAEASEHDLVLAPATAARIAQDGVAMPAPWPAEARDLLVRTLAGKGLLAVWETLEETGALEKVLPEWEEIRLLPHASAIHRFTVDRHVVETCIEAAKLIRRVDRPDLLMVAALLHDIGKGTVHDHSIAGEQIVRDVAVRLGFDDEDVETLALLVRWHLLLPEIATGRDLDDPVSIEEVVGRIDTRERLALLAALTQADSLAASAKAWSTWRASLVTTLVARADALLAAREVDAGVEEVAHVEVPLPASLLRGEEAVSIEVEPNDHGACITFVAADRLGLMADVAGVLGLAKLSVHGAKAWSQFEAGSEWAVSQWEVDEEYVDARLLRRRFDQVTSGATDLARLRGTEADDLAPSVAIRPRASRRSTVLEVRAGDRPGLLHEVLSALAELGVEVRSAHVDTVGPQAVDVFYLRELGADALSETRAAQAAHAVRAVLAPTERPVTG